MQQRKQLKNNSFCHLSGKYLSTRRPVDLSTCRPVDLSTRRPVDPSTCQPVDLSTRRPVDPSTRRPVNLSTCQHVDPSTCQSVDLSIYLHMYIIKLFVLFQQNRLSKVIQRERRYHDFTLAAFLCNLHIKESCYVVIIFIR